MTSSRGVRRLGAPLVVFALLLVGAPAALAAPPNVHPNVGSYSSQTPIDVSFVSDQPVTIHYTLDGSTPTAASPVYSAPIHITQPGTTTLSWLAANDAGETSSGREYYTIDTNPPTISISAPAQGATFAQYSPAVAAYSCADAELAWVSCVGSAPAGGAIDTSTVGQHTFTVIAYDAAGNRTEVDRTYTVNPATDGAGGTVPATLSVTLGSAPGFAAFVPGVTADYLTSLTANIISTAGDATLSVDDPSSFATGHLVNGSFALPSPLQVNAGGPFADVGGAANPTTLKTYSGPVSNDPVVVNFKQHIASTDALRTGTYAKTLTFTLSTTNP